MKTLLLDIELAPALVHAWGLRDQNIGINQVIAPGYMLCWAAKWYGAKEVQFSSRHAEPKRMLKRIHKLLDDADVVVSYNGKRFDLPHLNREFVLAGMTPPSPYKQVDLLNTARQQFRFASNKLDFLAQQLGLGAKVKHSGHELWIGCMANDPKAWVEMERYNRHDVVLLERLYDRLRPWVKLHPNHGLYDEPGVQVCTNCGSTRLQRRGFARTQVQKYARYQCVDCGSWMRDAAGELPKADRQVILRRDHG
jgi:DNA-directed RNA polymerase subunit RPC12/RpoP